MALDVPDGTPDRGPGLVALCIVLMIFVTTATIGRIASKVVMKQYWWWDDFFALLSYPIQITVLALIIVWRNIGLGLHADVVVRQNPIYLIHGAKLLYIAIFFFDSSISLPKLSALLFYARIFHTSNRRFTINLWIVGALVSGWVVSALISTTFQCTPIEKAWNPMLNGTCINTFAWYLATASISVVVDFYILLLPVPEIWALKISVRRRIYLLGAFFLAYSVIVISIGRLVSTVNLIPTLAEDLSWNFPLYLHWALLEGSVSLISISVPNLIGLFKAIRGSRRSGTSSKADGSNKSSSFVRTNASAGFHGGQAREGQRGGFERLAGCEDSFSYETYGKHPSGFANESGEGIPLDKIHVQTQISVSSGKLPFKQAV
ncbi:hypothetical protein F5Y01DRAFT_317958 [Xylaria sp. FL0043]|nr:hypothetical protein F5Y01DRAFT_317958 [Xylaria sp. FL0043]